MNRDDAKNILLLHRPGTPDAADPQILEALALTQRDEELARWFGGHCARQEVLRAQLRQIPAPAGLKEQIISEQAALEKIAIGRRNFVLTTVATAVVALLILATLWFRPTGTGDTLGVYRNRMIGAALRGYAMDLATGDPAKVRAYLKQNHAPADYILPAPLQKTAVTGCAIESWQGTKVSLICFRTGKPLPPGEQSDLWLFVVDGASVKNSPSAGPPELANVHQLITAVWAQGDKLYLLGTAGDEQTIRRLL
jgi:hypothetical protein